MPHTAAKENLDENLKEIMESVGYPDDLVTYRQELKDKTLWATLYFEVKTSFTIKETGLFRYSARGIIKKKDWSEV